MKTKTRFAGLFLCTMASAMSFASAATISVNFNFGPGNQGKTVTAVTVTAGVVAAANWNNTGNIPNARPYLASGLLNSAGVATTATINATST